MDTELVKYDEINQVRILGLTPERIVVSVIVLGAIATVWMLAAKKLMWDEQDTQRFR